MGLCLLAGCAEQTSIYHMRPVTGVPGTTALTVDAKQRSTYTTLSGGQVRLCAEAAPDVFSALSASASGDIGLDLSNGGTASGRARAAMAVAEAAGTIERTQTINLLRESMYRTCERWLSAAIDRSTFVVQAARDQRAMVAILAIEQLTRTARPPSTVVIAPTTGASVIAGDEAAKLITQFEGQRTAAQSAADKAKADFETAKTKGKCDTVTAAPAADATNPSLADWAACTAAKTTLDARNAELKAATDRLDKTLALAGQGLGSSTVASTGAQPSQPGGGGGTVSDAQITAVAEAVRAIANNPSIDEAMMFCIAYLTTERREAEARVVEPGTTSMCQEVVRARAEAELRFLGFVDAPAGKILRGYLRKPAVLTERQRRLQVFRTALGNLGYPSGPTEVAAFFSKPSPDQEALLAHLRTIETDAAARADLQ
ncbi:MAG TPA: hypothetical protein VGC56_11395 [Allosphingosinicella sp.]